MREKAPLNTEKKRVTDRPLFVLQSPSESSITIIMILCRMKSKEEDWKRRGLEEAGMLQIESRLL